MSITTLVVMISAPMPKSVPPSGLVVRASIRKTQVQSLARTALFMKYSAVQRLLKTFGDPPHTV